MLVRFVRGFVLLWLSRHGGYAIKAIWGTAAASNSTAQ